MKKINCFLPFSEDHKNLIGYLSKHEKINKIFLMGKGNIPLEFRKCERIDSDGLFHTATIRKIAEFSDSDYSMVIEGQNSIDFGAFAIDRFISIATTYPAF